jgi:hypothetical protein
MFNVTPPKRKEKISLKGLSSIKNQVVKHINDEKTPEKQPILSPNLRK